jgi:hypothetical protein
MRPSLPLAVLLALGPSATVAAAGGVAVAPIVVADNPGLGAAFEVSLAGGLSGAGVPVIAASEVAARQPTLAGCGTVACLVKLTEALGVTWVARGRVEVIGLTHFALAAEVLDGTGKVIGRAEGRCEVCTVAEANDQLTRLAATLAPRLTPPAPPRRTRPFLGLGVSAMILAAGAVAAGAMLLVLDGSEQGSYLDGGNHLVVETRDTFAGGVAATAAGGALLLSAILFLWRDARPPKPAPSRARAAGAVSPFSFTW